MAIFNVGDADKRKSDKNKGYADDKSVTEKKDYGKGPEKNTKETNKKE